MFYPKNFNKHLEKDLFKNPTAEYRGAPFWAWNTKLNTNLLNMEIGFMKEMGFGGFHMHTRVGMSTEYLSDEFMALIKNCVDKGRSLDMLSYLYDEDKWPSGYAGGYVTKNPEYRQKHLLFTTEKYKNENEAVHEIDLLNDMGARAERTENGDLLGMYSVKLDEDGFMTSYKKINEEAEAEENADIWYAYLETAIPQPWFNNQTYVDTLNKKALDEFIKVTHEAYKKSVGNSFGGDIPSIFTDEPQFTRKNTLNRSTDKTDVVMPFTTDLEETYTATYGESLLEKLPELFFEIKNTASVTRYRFHDHVAERFVTAFADNVGSWCHKNGIMLTGHVMEEPTLNRQAYATGEAMRSYRSFGMPGVDMLEDLRELNTVKQAASAAHQYGCPGVTSELYGVTNWNFDFRHHKLQGDWQAALGVSLRVPHLYWVAMGGEAKRDYPASIGHQSPWYKEYPFIEDHFARVNTLMTRGTPEIKVAVIHPIESMWLHIGPNDKTEQIRAEMDKNFAELTNWLLFNTVDFDFVSESLLTEQYQSSDKGFSVGKMTYNTVIVPNMETIRSSTLTKLTEFKNKGGNVIFMGEAPKLLDAVPSKKPQKFAEKCINIGWSKRALLDAISIDRDIEIRDANGTYSNNLIYGLRRDGNGKNLFICHVNEAKNQDISDSEYYEITVTGEYIPTLYNTLTGETEKIPYTYKNGNTVIFWNCDMHSSLLLRLDFGRVENTVNTVKPEIITDKHILGECDFELSEPNVFLLDMAEWKVDDGEWQPKEEMLRICDSAKLKLGYSLEGAAGCQPWVQSFDEVYIHDVTLKYTIRSSAMVEGAELALENLDITEIEFNGKPVDKTVTGKYVDVSIDKVALPTILRGDNTLILKVKFGPYTALENSFILGEFGVKAVGDSATIYDMPKTIPFGDITEHGFPFFGGNVIYKLNIEGEDKDAAIKLDRFAAPLVTAYLDGEKKGVIALAPYKVDLGKLSKGPHELKLCMFGSRVNTFGAIHNADLKSTWFGPPMWRRTGNRYTYSYQLYTCGILTEPRIITYK